MNDLSGRLLYALAVAVADAVILGWIVLFWYRSSVRSLMRPALTPSAAAHESTEVPSGVSESPLRVALFNVQSTGARGRRALEGLSTQERRLVRAYGTGAAVYAAVVSTVVFGIEARNPAAMLTLWWLYLWPLVPALGAALVLDRRSVVGLALAYVVGGCIAISLVTVASQATRGVLSTDAFYNCGQFLFGLLPHAVVLPGALLLLTTLRRIRFIAPLALTATGVFGVALTYFGSGLGAALDSPWFMNAWLGLAVSSSVEAAFALSFLLVSLPIGWLVWRQLRALSTAHERKRLSEVQLVIDAWWLLVTLQIIAGGLSIEYGALGIPIGLAAFAAYWISVRAMLAWTRTSAESPQRLLLLRVFRFQSRTEILFDRIAQRWRFSGPVQLIAAPDLAMRTTDPADLLSFLRGNLVERFVASPDGIAPRLAKLDFTRDPDGRYRVNTLYCRDETWRATLQALLDGTDVVLMDLRSFSHASQGCAFELEQLMARVPTERSVLVYDRSTDLNLLSGTLDVAWRRTHSTETTPAPIACVRVERNSAPELRVLMERLRGVAQSPRIVPLSELAAAA